MKGKKVKWLNILHFYQPPFQDIEVVKNITEECYLPVVNLLLKNPQAKAVININGCLLEMLDMFYRGNLVLELIKSLFSRKQIKITGTGKYHPIFPLINTKELKIQVLRQEMALHSILGITEMPNIFFLSELAYWPKQIPIFKEQGYTWMIIDEMSLKKDKHFMGQHLLKEKRECIKLLVRERDLSESLSNSMWRRHDINSPEDFLERSYERITGDGFIVTASDAEAFGHHHKERWKLLERIYDHPSVDSISTETIANKYKTKEVETVSASWSTSHEDILNNIYYPLWYHQENKLQCYLWQFLDLATDEIRLRGSESENKKLDTLFSSCSFFWASCKPWWNGIIVEKTADRLFDLLSEAKGLKDNVSRVAWYLRNVIYNEVDMLNRTGRAKELQLQCLTAHKLTREKIFH